MNSNFSLKPTLLIIFAAILSLMAPTLIASSTQDPINNSISEPARHFKSTKKIDWKLSAAMIFQDEAPYLKEWIDFHRLVGVQHFYLYNNLSTDHYFEVLHPYIISGEVELIEWPYEAHNVAEWDIIQCNAYQDALTKSRGKSKWLAIIDSDEFLVPVQTDSIPSLLAEYENDKKIGGVYAYWVVFGTSFVKKIPENKLLIESLVLNGGPGKGHSKSIVQPTKTIAIPSPHYAIYKEGIHHTEILHNKLQINHYWSRDEWYLHNVKIPRRITWGTSSDTCLYWTNAQNNQTPEGQVILRFVNQLRTLMGLPN